MKPFMFAHADAAQDPARELTAEELAFVTGGDTAAEIGPDYDVTQNMTKINGEMHRDSITDDPRG